jgi:hypothetical protein
MADIRFAGWNLGHACAFFGRSEITVWLSHKGLLGGLVTEKCQRKPYVNAYACHIAVSKGYTFVADVMLDAGCPENDRIGKPLTYYARLSGKSYVEEWADEKKKPLKLAKDVKALLRSFRECNHFDPKMWDKLKKVMDFDLWTDCGIESAFVLGPTKQTYFDVVVAFVEAVEGDSNAMWSILQVLCEYCPKRSFKWPSFRYFWKARTGASRATLDTRSLLDIAEIASSDFLVNCLHQSWASSITVDDATIENPVLLHLRTHFMDRPLVVKSLHGVRNKQVFEQTCQKLLDCSKSALCRILESGEQQVELIKVLRCHVDLADLYPQTNTVGDSYYELVIGQEINMGYRGVNRWASKIQPFPKQLAWFGKDASDWYRLYIMLAMEGYDELIRFSLKNGCHWESSMEIHMTRIAAILGHSKITDIFMEDSSCFLSCKEDRIYAAILGAAEAGRMNDLVSFSEILTGDVFSEEPAANFQFEILRQPENEARVELQLPLSTDETHQTVVLRSPLCAVLFGCVINPSVTDGVWSEHVLVLEYIMKKANAGLMAVLRSLVLVISATKICYHSYQPGFLDLVRYLLNNSSVNHLRAQVEIEYMSRYVFDVCRFHCEENNSIYTNLLEKWMTLVSTKLH